MSVPPPRLTDDRPDLPDELDDVLAAGLAKDAADRPESCGEFVRSLRAAVGGRPPLDLPGRVAPPGVPTARLPRDGAAPPTAGAPAAMAPAAAAPLTEFAVGNAGQQRDVTPVAPGPPPGGYGPPPGSSVPPVDPAEGSGGPGVPPPPPWGGPPPQSWPPAGPPQRGRRRWLLPAVIALVAVLAAGLVIWSPWSGPSLVTRDLVVVPFAADLPDDWQVTPVTGDIAYSVAGSRDWSGLSTDDSDAVAAAETALTDDPESLVHLYVDGSDNVYTTDAQGLADQLQSGFDEARFVAQGTREVDGREAFTASGVAQFAGGQLRFYGVTLQDEPRLLLLFVAPAALYDEWKPTFDRIADSVTSTG
jgi:hypothetical protein